MTLSQGHCVHILIDAKSENVISQKREKQRISRVNKSNSAWQLDFLQIYFCTLRLSLNAVSIYC